tara:strand:+ start:358 stop:549 length:192 start_codon:yes stop_codon:yes gene_type:complete
MLVPPVVVDEAEGEVLLVTVEEFVCAFISAPKKRINIEKLKILKNLKKRYLIFLKILGKRGGK